MDGKMECPICKKRVLFVGVHDDEGNYHGLVGCEYENDPWSGLSYALHHEGWGDCPLCTDGAYSAMGGMLFDTSEEAISTLTQPNEWISVDERLPEKDGAYLVHSGKSNTVYAAHFGKRDGRWSGKSKNLFITHWMPMPELPERSNNETD